MKAVFIREFGGVENLEIREVPEPPKPAGTQVLVRVRAAALNRADLLQRRGLYPAPAGFSQNIPGLEFAGAVSETSESVTKWKTGDRVFGLTAGEAQAEFVSTDENLLARIPGNLSFTEAGAVPEAFITAHDAVFTQAGLSMPRATAAGRLSAPEPRAVASGAFSSDISERETILIHAVGSGVGLAALQLAKAGGSRVFGTSRTIEKLERCREFGLDEPILTGGDANFADIIKEKTGGKGVDVILDLVGAAYLQRNLESAAIKGRLMLVGLTSGASAEFNLGIALSKRLKIIGTVLRGRSAEEKAQATRKFTEEVLPLLKSGKTRPNVDKIFSFNDVRDAHEYLESNESFGKVVLEF